ncbi:hypothetical protein [Variovorax terrae]|uniref:Lipoprotein n=1 Tax=Variovorax terrae TaxID=2923278 RepID=A0A9X1VWB2_9BURK|nr:hypothetical protein [Variovorax terrae]MCJ0763244.1 hypothetical protein [Variovorax terrae]
MSRLRIAGIILAAASATLLSGCVVAPVAPYPGTYYYPAAPIVVSPSIGFYGSYGYRRGR